MVVRWLVADADLLPAIAGVLLVVVVPDYLALADPILAGVGGVELGDGAVEFAVAVGGGGGLGPAGGSGREGDHWCWWWFRSRPVWARTRRGQLERRRACGQTL